MIKNQTFYISLSRYLIESRMAYTLRLKENLKGVIVSMVQGNGHQSPGNDIHFVVTNVVAKSMAESLGISIGDSIVNLNGKSMLDVAAQCAYKGQIINPNVILENAKVPLSITLMRKNIAISKMVEEILSEMTSPISPYDSVDYDRELISEIKEEIDDNDHRLSLSMSRDSFGSKYAAYASPPHSHPQLSLTLSKKSDASITAISLSMVNSNQSNISNVSESVELPKLSEVPTVSEQLLKRHIAQTYSVNPDVHFDTASITKSNNRVIAVSSKPFEAGREYEWTLEILQCDVDIQEIGVCTVSEIEGIQIAAGGAKETAALGARGIYGNELATASNWYCSYNKNGATRCFKDLAVNHHIGWTTKDQIKVAVNLNKWRIRFYLNGKRVC